MTEPYLSQCKSDSLLRETITLFFFGMVIFAQSFSIIFVSDYWDLLELRETRWATNFKFGSILFFFAFSIASIKDIFSLRYNILFLFLLGWFLLSALWSIDSLKTFQNVIALGLLATALINVRSKIAYYKLFSVATFVTLGVLVAAIIKFGIDGRFIGGNQPNIVSSIAFSGIIFSLMSGLKSRVVYITIFVLIVIMVNSRIFILCSTLTLSIFYLKTLSGKINLAIILSLLLLLLGVSLFYEIHKTESLQIFISEFLALHDEKRGLSSGMTGRLESNIIGVKLLTESPLLGFGYKTRGVIVSSIHSIASHSGLLNLALDIGIIGLTIFLVSLCSSYRTRKQLYSLTFFNDKNNKMKKSIYLEQAVNIAALPAYILLLLVEPNHIQVGLATNMLYLLFLLPQTAITKKIT